MGSQRDTGLAPPANRQTKPLDKIVSPHTLPHPFIQAARPGASLLGEHGRRT